MVTHRLPAAAESEPCSDLLVCATTDVVALALGSALLLFAAILATVAHVRSASSVADGERERVRLEAEALTDFAQQVATLDAGPVGVAGRPGGAATLVETAAAAASPLRDVEDAYRETVMAVPHYEAEYDEPLAQNMAAEFGDDVASAVVTGHALTPQLKETLLQRSGRSHRLRLALLDHLDAEADDVASAAADYDRIADSLARIEDESIEDGSFEDLLAEWYLLEDRERQCVDRLRRRQETIQSRRGLAKHFSDAPTLEEYLYGPLEVTYPVLADGTRLLGEIRAARRRIVLAIASFGQG